MQSNPTNVNLLDLLWLPRELGVAALLVAFALLLAPYLSGQDFGVVKIPSFKVATRKRLRVLGPFVLLLCALAFVPFWRKGAERFVHANGYFEKVGIQWVEYPPFAFGRNFLYVEQRREQGFIYAVDSSRPMYIRFPADGGMSQWSSDNVHWVDLYFVRRDE